ncbi:hypothetical protein KQH82_01220 [bacterium]|nr:hypothetical protein [bacterium]
MKAKTVLTVVLLLFVAASVVWLVAKGGNSPAASENESMAPVSSENDPAPEHQVIVYYFHGTNRCQTCLKIEALADQAVQSGFETELAGGSVVWRVVNFDLPENKSFVDEYGLYSQALIVVDKRDGKRTDWKNLADIWELVGNEPEFTAYVQREVSSYLGAS